MGQKENKKTHLPGADAPCLWWMESIFQQAVFQNFTNLVGILDHNKTHIVFANLEDLAFFGAFQGVVDVVVAECLNQIALVGSGHQIAVGNSAFVAQNEEALVSGQCLSSVDEDVCSIVFDESVLIFIPNGEVLDGSNLVADAVGSLNADSAGISLTQSLVALEGLILVLALRIVEGTNQVLGLSGAPNAGNDLTGSGVDVALGQDSLVPQELFFLLVIFAALTSSISLMEAIVSIIHDKFHIGRKTCCFITLGISIILGVPSSLGFGVLSFINPLGTAGGSILDFFDFISNNILMPIVALLTCILVGYVIKTKTISDEVEINGKFKGKKLFEVVVKYIAPVCIVAILVFSVLDVFFKLS